MSDDARRCVDCGVLESQGTDRRGRPGVNLDPQTGRCVRCLCREGANKLLPFTSRKRAGQPRRDQLPTRCRCGSAGVKVTHEFERESVIFDASYCGVCGRNWPKQVTPTEAESL